MHWTELCNIQLHPLMLANNLMVVNAAEFPCIYSSKKKYICYVASETEHARLLNDPTPLLKLLEAMEFKGRENESLKLI